jgi:CubicO group peptidase (beta-lactamase class C family)
MLRFATAIAMAFVLVGCNGLRQAHSLTPDRAPAREPQTHASPGAVFQAPTDPDALPSTVAGLPAGAFAEEVSQARKMAREAIVKGKVPGVSIAVAADGKLVWAEGLGWADLAERRPVTPDTVFRVGSVAKPFTAAAVGLLVERGRLDLDAPVRTYVPSFPDKGGAITLRRLLSHSSGIRHHVGDRDLFWNTPCKTQGEALARFAKDPLGFEPGTREDYSTYGFVLAGAAVEAAAGQAYARFVQNEIFAPLGMKHTGVDPSGPLPRGHATPYFPAVGTDLKGGLKLAPEVDTTCVLAGGGFVSTPSDLVRFGLAMSSGKLLKPQTTKMLQTRNVLSDGKPGEQGLGWVVREVPLVKGRPPAAFAGHGGHNVGGTTSFMTFPGYGIVVAVSTNTTSGKPVTQSLAPQIAALFAESMAKRGFRELAAGE